MLSIYDRSSLLRALGFLNHRMKHLLTRRLEQLGGDIAGVARFVVFQLGDRATWLEQALGFSIFENAADGTAYGDPDYSPGFEYVVDHRFCFELVFQFTDAFTHVILVENAKGVDRRLLQLAVQGTPLKKPN